MGDNLVTANLVNNLLSNDEPCHYLDGRLLSNSKLLLICQTKKSLVNNLLSNDEPCHYLDGGLLSNSKLSE